MEIKGKCIAVADLRSGQSQSGNNWQKRDFVIETTEKYPRKVSCTLFGDKVSLCPSVGSYVSVSFDIDAHEYNGRWFNSIRAWKVERVDPNVAAQQVQTPPFPTAAPQPQVAQQAAPMPENNPFPASAEGDSNDDLPF